MWFWRRMEKISQTNSVENELHSVKDEMKIIHTIKQKKANWIGHILHTNCLLRHTTDGKIEGMGRKGRRCKQLLNGLKETRGYQNLRKEALDHTLCRTCCGRIYGPVTRLTTY
jgi:hypothetical protein